MHRVRRIDEPPHHVLHAIGRLDDADEQVPLLGVDALEDLYRAFDDRAQVILNALDARDWDLLVGVIESTDRVQHMMWRLIDPKHPMYDAALAAHYGDSIERVYRKRRRLRRRSGRARRSRRAGDDCVRPRLPLVAQGGQPEHLAGAEGLHGAAGPAAGREEARRICSAAALLGERRLVAHQRLRDGPRPDLLQPSRPRSAGDRQPRAEATRARRRVAPPGC